MAKSKLNKIVGGYNALAENAASRAQPKDRSGDVGSSAKKQSNDADDTEAKMSREFIGTGTLSGDEELVPRYKRKKSK